MNETILLELTKKEAEVVKKALIKERIFWEDSVPTDVGPILIENNLTLCGSIWAKLDRAFQPKEDLLIYKKDLSDMISMAKNDFVRLHGDLHISNKKIEQKDFVHISVANSVIVWLNSKNLLKRLVKFDYTDQSCEYEEME